jgi:hypothetical protein
MTAGDQHTASTMNDSTTIAAPLASAILVVVLLILPL